MEEFELRQSEQSRAAASRVGGRMAEREHFRETLTRPGGLANADSPERVAKRLDRLSRYYSGEQLPTVPSDVGTAPVEDLVTAALKRSARMGLANEEAASEGLAATGVVLERIINTADFVDIRYLEAGVAAARAVGRVHIRDKGGDATGYGSGSLVSPRLFLTNHHVLPNADVALASAVEFNYQDGVNGQPLQSTIIRFDPETLFLSDQERDFALVAVKGGEQALAQFGFNRLIEAEGKAVIGECVTIVQHPRGEKKQVALRDNRIIDMLESFLHYEADTEPGSSGSPVFNDQWEVVALHHASAPAPEREELGGFVNEGIRVSRILAFVHSQHLPPAMAVLVEQLLAAEAIVTASPAAPVRAEASSPQVMGGDATAPAVASRPMPSQQAQANAAVSFTVPIEISVRLRGGFSDAEGRPPARPSDTVVAEAITIDPDYASRGGYDPEFLGTGAHLVALPVLSDRLMAMTSTNTAAGGASRFLFPYHHFSVVMNKERALAILTAVNIDGRLSRRLRRERDRWFLDPRLPVSEQTGEAVYADNDLDRGHLVRRLDPAWATSEPEAKRANDDTFHFTNCTPQHKDFNQNQTTWAGLEDYVLENADNRDLRVTVLTGPVFAADDDQYRGVKLPRQFWKVVAMIKHSGSLSATGYLLSQEHLIRGLEAAEEFSYGAYRTFQVPIRDIEALTELSFGSLNKADPLGGLEAVLSLREVRDTRDLII